MFRLVSTLLFVASDSFITQVASILGDDNARFFWKYPKDSELKLGESVGYAVHLMEAAFEDGAICIDGSTPVYYFSPATDESGANKYYIFFQGGGWCSGNLQSNGKGFNSCYDRSKSTLGSSMNYGPWLGFGTNNYFDTNPATNPTMYNWNKVYIMYCDGASFGGNREYPANITVSKNNKNKNKNDKNTENNNKNNNKNNKNGKNGKNNNNKNETFSETSEDGDNVYMLLYSRGHRILKAAYNDLIDNMGMIDATDIVISGGSAGGLATWLHSDWIYENLLKPKLNIFKNSENANKFNIAALPDSGYFLDYNGYMGSTNYSNGLKWVFINGNMSYSSINQGCIDNYGGTNGNINNVSNCIFAQNIAPFVNIPLFALNSEYDSWQVANILGTNNETIVNIYGKNFTNIMYNNFIHTNNLNTNNNNHGAFLDSCLHHCGNWDNMKNGNYTQATAFDLFYNEKVIGNSNDTFVWFQNQTYPCKSCC